MDDIKFDRSSWIEDKNVGARLFDACAPIGSTTPLWRVKRLL